jgi:cyclic-di-GMP phosphodiesterase TipF (flagellum assembly factor)
MLGEMSSRRTWEQDLLGQIHRMNNDYERLVREVARNRNDSLALKKNLVEAGTLARSYGRTPGGEIEKRMVKALAEQLVKLGDAPVEEQQAAEAASAFSLGVLEKDSTLKEADESTIGKRLSDDQVQQLVTAAVKQDRIDLFLQPIVNLPQRKLRFHEMLSRIRIMPDVYLPAVRYIQVAMEQDLMPVIDNLLLLRGLQLIRDTEGESYNRAFFCNITALTLNDPKFMGDLVEFISQNRALAPKLIFELGQADLASMSADILPVFEGLSKLGCRFSMDRVRSISFDYSHLEARHIRFIKTDAALLLTEMNEVGGLQRMKRLKSELDRRGIDLIAEKIETDKQLLNLLDIEIDYGQGYLFGRPVLCEKS